MWQRHDLDQGPLARPRGGQEAREGRLEMPIPRARHAQVEAPLARRRPLFSARFNGNRALVPAAKRQRVRVG
jgi:hypothetical protein